MVKMHKDTQTRNIGCFVYHKLGEKQLGKKEPKDPDFRLKRRAKGFLWMECHKP